MASGAMVGGPRKLTVYASIGLVAFVGAVLVGQAIEERSATSRIDARLALFEAVEHGRYADALSGLQEMSENGDLRAQVQLAQMYARGLGVAPDRERAASLYEAALAGGVGEVRLPLARLLEDLASGDAASPAMARAAELYREAAEVGEAEGMIRVGEMLLAGAPLPADPVAGARWLLRAAGQGSAVARLRVGELYRAGIGVPMDPVRAHAWLNLAVASFPPADAEARDRAVAARAEVERFLSRSQLDRAVELAHQIYAQGA